MIARAIAGIIALSLAAPVSAAAPIAGRWLTPDGAAQITIGACGAVVCGRVTRILKANPSGATTDQRNPDARLRARPLLGLEVLSTFADTGDDWRGRIYDPKSGKSYKSIVVRDADGSLSVKGCIAFFCQSQRWTKAA